MRMILVSLLLPMTTSVYGVEQGSERVADWRSDLKFYANKMEKVHYNPFTVISKQAWREAVARLDNKLEELDDHQRVVALMELAALAGDGHTGIWPIPEGRMQQHQLPFMFGHYKEGIFVRAAPREYEDVVGARLLTIGTMSTDQAVERLMRVSAGENKWTRRLSVSEYYILIPEILYGAGISPQADLIDLTFEKPNGEKISLSIKPDKPVDLEFATRLMPNKTWVTARQNAEAPTPLWLKRVRKFPESNYWFKYLKESKIVYLQFNVVNNRPSYPLSEFARKLTAYIDKYPVTALVIDIRLNNGGNTHRLPPLLDAIKSNMKINQKGKLFTIIGNKTYSAAMNFAAMLEQQTNTMFVGEPTGSKPNFIGESNPFTLPKTGIRFSISNKYWQNAPADDNRKWIAPDLPAKLSFEDFRENRDPAMEAIIEYLKERP